MDTFTTRSARPVDGHGHHAAQGFCTVCGTAWPCWNGLRETAAHGRGRLVVSAVGTAVLTTHR